MRKVTVVYENPLEIHMKSRERLIKAQRKVKSNGKTVIGKFPSKLNGFPVQFESGLEDDFIAMLEFDRGVKEYFEQPVKITYMDGGKRRTYTPDFLVYFKENKNSPPKKPILYEVKSRKHIKKNWRTLKPKFLAAMRYCDTQGWRFKIITEKEIKSQHTENIKFLLRYMQNSPDSASVETLQLAMQELGECTAAELISHYTKDFMRQADLVPAMWYMVGNNEIKCDLTQKITMATKLSI
jgi:hypothetical protein